ncbi:MAG: MotA/TolQ/ExbB proton channel family protein, partial [Gammaproteobacteria bacterium]
EALLTTAAGLAIAIPAAAAVHWIEGVVEQLRHDTEDAATRLFTGATPPNHTAPSPTQEPVDAY